MNLPYGPDEIQFEVSETRLLDILNPRNLAGVEDAYRAIIGTIRNPVDDRSLLSQIKAGETVTIVTDDHTRPTPAGPICTAIMDELNSVGIDDSHHDRCSRPTSQTHDIHCIRDSMPRVDKCDDRQIVMIPSFQHGSCNHTHADSRDRERS